MIDSMSTDYGMWLEEPCDKHENQLMMKYSTKPPHAIQRLS
jgi:hypothetical protein